MTSFYMFRMVFLAFFGSSRTPQEKETYAHESPPSMTIPLQFLAVGSLIAGWVGVPHVFHLHNYFEQFLEPVFSYPMMIERSVHAVWIEWVAMGLSLGIAFSGLLLAFGFYIQRPILPSLLSQRFRACYDLLLNKYWVDEVYQKGLVNPLVSSSKILLWKFLDIGVIDGSVNGIGKFIYSLGSKVREIHSGQTRAYAGWILLGSVAFIAYWTWLA
jgi:NADH-quinone oxidoreductase subunit L